MRSNQTKIRPLAFFGLVGTANFNIVGSTNQKLSLLAQLNLSNSDIATTDNSIPAGPTKILLRVTTPP